MVVLDLDETLVHSTFHGAGARMYRQIEKRKSKIRRQVESFSLCSTMVTGCIKLPHG